MKQRWYYCLPVKLFSLLLLLACLIGSSSAGYLILKCGQAGFYNSKTPSFADSYQAWQVCSANYENCIDAILESYSSDRSLTVSEQKYLESMRSHFSAENTNLRVILESPDSDGMLALETLLGLTPQDTLEERHELICRYSYRFHVTGGRLGQWLNVPETGLYTDAPDTSYAFDREAVEVEEVPVHEITVSFYLDTTLPVIDAFSDAYFQYTALQDYAIPAACILSVCILLGFVNWIYLMCAAGYRPNTGRETITLRFIDRIPYDLFLGLCAVPLIVLAGVLNSVLSDYHYYDPYLFFLLGSISILGILMTFTLLSLSTAVRWKSHTLLRNTVIWRICRHFWRLLTSIAGKVGERLQPQERSPEEQAQKQEQRTQTFNRIGKGAKATVSILDRIFGTFGRWLSQAWRRLNKSFSILPVVWKGLLLLLGVGVVNVCLLIMSFSSYDGVVYLIFLAVFDMAVLWKYLSILQQMIWLHNGAKQIAAGDLEYRIPTDLMKWEFKAHGEALNAIRSGIDAAVEERVKAVEERIKSDRMRSELLTNVSHDIKTPLTSIINYVDLLKKEPVESAKTKEYLEVLDRQSIRLKKLLEDLLEASKASTGNITVNATPTSIGELLRQVAGEYAEKLTAAKLEPIITLPGQEAVIFADGRLLWRVFDNLMANIVKYAMPQTRVYLDLQSDASMTVVAVKNVSRERLNIAADELMERFVRGDTSRSTEGSGLGLSIAQSLTELMGGTFSLMIDGDLFKVQLGFPTLHEKPAAQDAPTAVQTPLPKAQDASPAVQSVLPEAQAVSLAVQAPLPTAQDASPAVQSVLPEAQAVSLAVQAPLPETQDASPAVQSVLPEAQAVSLAVQAPLPEAQDASPAVQTALPETQTTPPTMSEHLRGSEPTPEKNAAAEPESPIHPAADSLSAPTKHSGAAAPEDGANLDAGMISGSSTTPEA